MGQNTPKSLKTNDKNQHFGIHCPWVANRASTLISNGAQSRVSERFVGYYSFTSALQREIFLNAHRFWLFPCYKPKLAPRHFLLSPLG